MWQAIIRWLGSRAKPTLTRTFAQLSFSYLLALLFGLLATAAMEAPVLTTPELWLHHGVTIGASVSVLIFVDLLIFPWLRRKSLSPSNRFGRPSKEKVTRFLGWLALLSIVIALVLRGIWSNAVFPSLEPSRMRVACYLVFVFLIKFFAGLPAAVLRTWLDKLQPHSPE